MLTRNTIPINYLLYGTTTSSSALNQPVHLVWKHLAYGIYNFAASGPADC